MRKPQRCPPSRFRLPPEDVRSPPGEAGPAAGGARRGGAGGTGRCRGGARLWAGSRLGLAASASAGTSLTPSRGKRLLADRGEAEEVALPDTPLTPPVSRGVPSSSAASCPLPPAPPPGAESPAAAPPRACPPLSRGERAGRALSRAGAVAGARPHPGTPALLSAALPAGAPGRERGAPARPCPGRAVTAGRWGG